MNVSFNGIGGRPVTFLNNGAKAGEPVKLSAAGTVSPCAAGDAFDGVAALIDGTCAGVRLGGFVTVGYTGTAPVPGRAILTADGSGGVKTAESGDRYLVVDRDTAAATVTILM